MPYFVPVSSLRWLVVFAALGCSETGETTEQLPEGFPEEFVGLSAPVDVVVDTRGIPHIFGKTDADVMYASGYQTAVDRLFQLDLSRRRALGTQAAVRGPDFIEQDELSRMIDFRRWGAATMERLLEEDPHTYHQIVAWVAGVNTRIEEVRNGEAPLPYGFGPAELDYLPEPFTVDEHAAFVRLLMFANTNSLEFELMATIFARNFPDAWNAVQLCRPAFEDTTMPVDERPASPRAASAPKPLTRSPAIPPSPLVGEAARALHHRFGHIPFTGSNNIAFDGRHTQNGKPMAFYDPHQPLQSPSLVYSQHLSSEDVDVMGWTFVGAAGVALGFNEHVQWTATTHTADVMDVWEVDDGGGTVSVGGMDVPVENRQEVIEVAGESAHTFVARDVPGYGILLPNDFLPLPVAGSGKVLLVNWTGFAATSEEQGFFAMARAQNIDEWEAAVDTLEVAGFNFIASGAEAISYRVNLRVPDRGDPSARPMPYLVVDGSDPASLWSVDLPPERLPRSRGITDGWLTTGNEAPFGFTFDGDVTNDPWYYGYFHVPGDRAHRLSSEAARLAARGGVTTADLETLQMDTRSPQAELALPALFDAWDQLDSDDSLERFRAKREDLGVLVDALKAWDGRMDVDSSGALIFYLWSHLLAEEIVADELSLLYPEVITVAPIFITKIAIQAITGTLPDADVIVQGGRNAAILEALDRASRELAARFGSVDPAGYAWGDVHGVRFEPLLEGLTVPWTPTPGSIDTVNHAKTAFLGEDMKIGETFDQTLGPLFRIITSFDDEGRVRAVANLALGQQGDPTAPHFADSLPSWIDGTYTPLPFTREEVDAEATTSMTLVP